MLKTFEKSVGKAGFTLVELLTVMAIIALLIGLLVPALGHVKTTAKIVQQKAQLKSIETALEAFSGMYGDYPPSNETSPTAAVGFPGYTAATYITCGAQKLAEAVLGIDLKGFDPKSDFDRRITELSKEPYAVLGMPVGTLPADVDASINRRKGPYVKIDESVGSFELANLYATTGALYAGGEPGRDSAGNPAKRFGNVITDVFKVKNVTYTSMDFTTAIPTAVQTTSKVGTPILYYKADASKKKLDSTSDATIDDSIYNWHDNMHLVSRGRMNDQLKPHWWQDDGTVTGTANPARGAVPGTLGDAAAFYSYIQNPKISTSRWPYNQDTYILISAGPDGIYGTNDDICNFNAGDAK